MGLVLTLLRVVGPVLLRGAESGTLVEIAEAAATLIGLLRPLLTDPKTQQSLDQVTQVVETVTAVHAAQPEDPVFARQGRPKFGGR